MAERLHEDLHHDSKTPSLNRIGQDHLPNIALPGELPAEPVAIAHMAEMFGVTHRTLHFYEEKGLIKAGRIGLMRVYSHADISRMALINACREVGMPIAVIQELMADLTLASSQGEADAIFQQALLIRKRELTAALSTIRRQMQQIIVLLSPDGANPPTAQVDSREHVDLSELERRCLGLMAEGYTPTRIARALNLAGEEIAAVENMIIQKFDARNRFQAVAKAVLFGLVAS